MRIMTCMGFLAILAAAPALGPAPAPSPAPVQAPAEAQAGLKAGDLAPDFSLEGSDGKTHTLAEHKGKTAVVIAWFPKAFTGG